ncbi:MAG: hypothetical protein QX197_03700 [Methylococcaceae bacterium]
MKNSFFLIIPPQRKSTEHIKNFQEGALKHWVEELPTANPSLVTRLFHDFIVEFNQIEMEPALRLDALEILRPSCLVIEDYLRARLMQANFPKTAGDQKIMEILFAIEKEFALAYWMVVRELTSKEVGWFQSKNTTLAIQRCIKSLSAIVVTFCSLYRGVPDWVWIDLHSLYKLSEVLNKQANKIPAEFNHTVKMTTIETSYQQILLFSLVQPSRLMQKEILPVYFFLETVSPYLQMENKAIAHYATQCLLCMDDDKPPSFQQHSSAVADSSVRYLNFDKLFSAFKFKDRFTASGLVRFSSIGVQQGDYSKVSVDLLDYIEQRWRAHPLPERMVFSDRLDRFVALGLEAAFNLKNAVFSATEPETEFLVQTASERSLIGDFNHLSVLSVGSLISIRKVDAPEHLRSLGIVSKLVSFKYENKMRFEVDLLAEHFYAVSFEYLEEKKPLQRKKALLYGVKVQGEEEKSFIIIESFMLKDGAIVRMFMMNEDYPIIIKDRKNIGLGYWRFECRRMPETMATLSNKKQGYDFI